MTPHRRHQLTTVQLIRGVFAVVITVTLPEGVNALASVIALELGGKAGAGSGWGETYVFIIKHVSVVTTMIPSTQRPASTIYQCGLSSIVVSYYLARAATRLLNHFSGFASDNRVAG